MKYVDIKGQKVPALGFGTWKLSGNECITAVQKALELGYRHIDTAQIYENEAEVGQALAESKVSREDCFITTKIWTTNFKAADVKASFDISLKKLRMDYVNLLLIHWPNNDVPLKETLGAMQKLKDAGTVRSIGVSNFPVELMRQARETLGYDIACNQVEYHVMLSQKNVLSYARAHDIAVTAYSPLGRGGLGENATLAAIAAKYGKTAGQIALNWLVTQDKVLAIPKAGSEKHMRENLDIFDFNLDAQDQKSIDALNGDGRLVNPDWAPQWDAA